MQFKVCSLTEEYLEPGTQNPKQIMKPKDREAVPCLGPLAHMQKIPQVSPRNTAPGRLGVSGFAFGGVPGHKWEFPNIGDPKIVLEIAGSLLQGPQNKVPLIFGNSQIVRGERVFRCRGFASKGCDTQVQMRVSEN